MCDKEEKNIKNGAASNWRFWDAAPKVPDTGFQRDSLRIH